MLDLDQRIQRLLGESAVSPLQSLSDRYHSSFHDSGVSKAKEILDTLDREKVDLRRFGYLSIGGSVGSELLHVMENSAIEHGILLEYDNDAADIAQENAKTRLPSKFIRVLCGDATQKIEACRRVLTEWREEGRIDGIVCSIQAVLHELPTRSPGFNLGHLIGEALWDWDPCFFF